MELRERLLEANRRLCRAYGCPLPFFSERDPLSELVGALLSHRTRNADSARAYRALRARFPSWEAVRDAPAPEVEAALAGVTWPEQKAPRLQAVLREVTARRGRLELDFLAGLGAAEAQAWLQALPGVGPKTAGAVLLFSRLRRPALVVDSHHHRVAVRLGLVPARCGPGPAHDRLAALLPPDWDAQALYDHHEAFMLHGQRVCTHAAPACGRCPVLDLCPTGRARLGAGAASPASPG